MAQDIGGIAGIILAAGMSRRPGPDLLLIPIDGVPLIRRSIDRAMYGGVAPIVVVTGPDPRPYVDVTIGSVGKFEPLANPDASMSDALHAGLEWVPAANVAAVVLLPEMVHVTSEMIRAVVDRHRATEAPLVASRYGKVPAPPFLIARTLFAEFLEWSGDGWGEPVVHRHRRKAEWLDWPADAAAEVRTAEDLAAFMADRRGTPDSDR